MTLLALNLLPYYYHCIFNGCVCHQIDGVEMGSPLGPLFADVFISFHEKTWLQICPSAFRPLLYRRYVGNCFLLFHSLDHISHSQIAQQPTSQYHAHL